MKYPFRPKSTKHLEPGQFWGIPLRSGQYAAGVVLAHAARLGKRDTRLLCIGLLDWCGDAAPTAGDLAAAQVLEHGFAHVRSIQQHGGNILGELERDWGLEPELDFNRLAGSGIPVWGLAVVHYRAEQRWGDAEWVKGELNAQWKAMGVTRAVT
jgi:hypothetical protein